MKVFYLLGINKVTQFKGKRRRFSYDWHEAIFVLSNNTKPLEGDLQEAVNYRSMTKLIKINYLLTHVIVELIKMEYSNFPQKKV